MNASNHQLNITLRRDSLNVDSLLVGWKLTVLLFFFRQGLFVLKYADSSNQRDFFLHRSLFQRICPIKSVQYA